MNVGSDHSPCSSRDNTLVVIRRQKTETKINIIVKSSKAKEGEAAFFKCTPKSLYLCPCCSHVFAIQWKSLCCRLHGDFNEYL